MLPAKSALFPPEQRQFILRSAAILTYGELGKWTYDTYAELNQRYFDGSLALNTIQWGLTPHGRTLGFYSSTFDTIRLHQSLLHASDYGDGNPWGMGARLGKRLASDILLHEMIHQVLHQQGRYAEGDDPHHCQAWCNELSRIAKRLELPSYWYAPYRKTTKRVPTGNLEIAGKYCDLTTHRVRKPPTTQTSCWVLVDESDRAKAQASGLEMAEKEQITSFPIYLRPQGYYSEKEQNLIEQTTRECP